MGGRKRKRVKFLSLIQRVVEKSHIYNEISAEMMMVYGFLYPAADLSCCQLNCLLNHVDILSTCLRDAGDRSPPPFFTTLFVSYLLRQLITKRNFVSRTIEIVLEEQSTLVSIDCLARRNMMQKYYNGKTRQLHKLHSWWKEIQYFCYINSTVWCKYALDGQACQFCDLIWSHDIYRCSVVFLVGL